MDPNRSLFDIIDSQDADAGTEGADADGRLTNQERKTIDRWVAGKKGNIRALLSTLHTILWEDCRWKPVPMQDIVNPGKIRKVYLKV